MTHAEVLRYVCRTYALAYHSIADYSHACDGFCDLCPNADDLESYRNDGHALRWSARPYWRSWNGTGSYRT